jgi:hypothetical protein
VAVSKTDRPIATAAALTDATNPKTLPQPLRTRRGCGSDIDWNCYRRTNYKRVYLKSLPNVELIDWIG